MSERRHFIKRTLTESFEYDPADIDRLWALVKDSVPKYLLGGNEDADQEARVIAVFTAFEEALVSPFGSREDYDVGHELYVEDEDGNLLSAAENGHPETSA